MNTACYFTLEGRGEGHIRNERKKNMEKFTVFSRVVLIAVALYGIFQMCEKLKPQMENSTQYIIMFIALFIVAFWSIIDWGVKSIVKNK